MTESNEVIKVEKELSEEELRDVMRDSCSIVETMTYSLPITEEELKEFHEKAGEIQAQVEKVNAQIKKLTLPLKLKLKVLQAELQPLVKVINAKARQFEDDEVYLIVDDPEPGFTTIYNYNGDKILSRLSTLDERQILFPKGIIANMYKDE